MIQAEHLQKTFRVRKRNAGFKNAAKAFFSREYEEIHALNDVSFRIEDGEAVATIGPNGCRKKHPNAAMIWFSVRRCSAISTERKHFWNGWFPSPAPEGLPLALR